MPLLRGAEPQANLDDSTDQESGPQKEEAMPPLTWDRVRRRLDEIEHIDALRTAAAAMRSVLDRLAVNPSLQSTPPYVCGRFLVFPGAFERSAVLHWNELEGYRISLAWLDRQLSETRTVPVDQLAEQILSYLERCRVPFPAADDEKAEMDWRGWNWEKVERRLTEAEQISLFRTTAAAMKRILPRLRTELQALSPVVSHVTLGFPCALQDNGVLLIWDEEHGYQVSLGEFSKKAVSEDELAEEILSYLERCQPEPTPPSATPSPPPKTKQAKRRAPPKRPTPPSPPKTKRAKRRAPPKR